MRILVISLNIFYILIEEYFEVIEYTLVLKIHGHSVQVVNSICLNLLSFQFGTPSAFFMCGHAKKGVCTQRRPATKLFAMFKSGCTRCA